MNRRAFLGTVGSGLLWAGLPRLSRGASPPSPPKRLVIVMGNNGTQQNGFWPSGPAFSSPILAPLLSRPRLAARTLAVRGVYLPNDANRTDGNQHDMGCARLWTGEQLLAIGGHPWGGGPSVDQLVARRQGIDSLTLAIHTSAIEPHVKPGEQNRRSFCYVAPGVHKLPTLDPFAAYTRLFWGGGAQLTAESRRRLLQRRSALDAVTADLRALQKRASAADAARLQSHGDAVRRLELRLSDLLDGRPGPGASCAARPSQPRDYTNTGPELLVNDESAIPELARSHIDLMVAALACDLTRVATLQLGFAGAKWKFKWLGLDENHHGLAHQDTSDAGPASPEVLAKLIAFNRWYAEQIAYLAAGLDAIPEGDGTLLDHTLIVWANEFGRGDHSQENIPILFVGGSAFGFSGGRLVDAGRQPFQRLGCTVLRAMGHEVAGFGDLPDCGALIGL